MTTAVSHDRMPMEGTDAESPAPPSGRLDALDVVLLIVIAMLPVGLALANDGWMYSKIGWLDTWYYVGYAYNYATPAFLADYYKISRLPWILVQWATRRVFDPVPANYFLQLGCLFAMTGVTYVAMRDLFGRMPAFVAAAFLAVYTPAHGSGGADYHNTLAGPLYALALLLHHRAGRAGGPPILMLSSGALAALTVHTNIVFVNLLPLLAIQYLAAHPTPRSLKDHLRALGWWVLGVVGITVVLGAINAAVGRHFLFFRVQVGMVSSFVADSSKQRTWWTPWATMWFLDTRYLGPLAAGYLFSIVALIVAWYRRSDPQARMVAIVNAQFLLVGTMWMLWQAAGHTALDFSYFHYPLILPWIATLAANIALFTGPVRAGTALLVGVCAIPALLWPVLSAEPLGLTLLGQLGRPAVQVFVAFTLAFAAMALPRVHALGLVVVLLLLGYGNRAVTGGNLDYLPTACHAARDGYVAIIDAHHRLLRHQPVASRIFVWFDEGEITRLRPPCTREYPASYFGYSLTATGFQYLQEPWKMPPPERLRPDVLKKVAARDPLVVVVTKDPRPVQAIQARFAEVGVPMQVLSTETVQHGQAEAVLHLLVRGDQPRRG